MSQAHTRLVTGQQMGAIDRRAIGGGLAGADLMEAAGLGVIQVLQRQAPLRGRRLAVLCGKGNNGGDGFVVARHASAAGAAVRTFLLAEPGAVRGDAAHHLALAQSAGVAVETVLSRDGLNALTGALADSDVVIDSMLGTGIRGGAAGLIAEAICAISASRRQVVAVDVPSGLDADTGAAEGPCAAAGHTVTFARPKRGHLFYPGRSLCGRLHVIDIGIPAEAVDAEPGPAWWIAAHGGAELLPRRKPDAHKGDCGRVAILAGSRGMTGAAWLTARAALRTGSGLVTVGIPNSLNDVLEAKLTEAMTLPLPEVRQARCLSLRGRGDAGRLLAEADAAAIGPGLGRHRETQELVRRLLTDIRCPVVLDADALNALQAEPERIRGVAAPVVITPHPGEFARLTGLDREDVLLDPTGRAARLAKRTNAWVVLKGAPTVVASPDEEVFVNASGNAGMASGGTGDVLTGLIASLLGQGMAAGQAACLGVYWHGLAGDIAAETLGQAGMLAGDLVESLPAAERAMGSGADAGRYVTFQKSEPQEP